MGRKRLPVRARRERQIHWRVTGRLHAWLARYSRHRGEPVSRVLWRAVCLLAEADGFPAPEEPKR